MSKINSLGLVEMLLAMPLESQERIIMGDARHIWVESRKSLLAGLREKVEGLKLGADRPANHVYTEGYEEATRDVLALLDEQD